MNNTWEVYLKWKNIKLDNILDRLKITDNIFSNIEDILLKSEIKNWLLELEDFFLEVDKLKENWKNIYNKYGKTPEDKFKIIGFILENLQKILVKLKISRIYNLTPDIYLDDFSEFDSNEQARKILFSKRHNIDFQEILWSSCNYWILWGYNLLYKEIMNLDNKLKVNFTIGKNAHWIMYFIETDKILKIENGQISLKSQLINEEDFIKEPKKKLNLQEYFNELEFKKDLSKIDELRFVYNWKLLKCEYKNWKLEIYFWSYNDNKIIHFWKRLNYTNKKDLKEILIEKIWKENIDIIDLFLEKIQWEKILKVI